MRALRIICLVCAFVLASGGTTSFTSDTDPAPRESAASPSDSGDDDTQINNTPDMAAVTVQGGSTPAGRQRRKKDNAFVRVITAPFRGLAKLFGKDKGRTKIAGADVEDAPKPRPASDSLPTSQSTQPAPAPQNVQVTSPTLPPPVPVAPQPLPTPPQTAAAPPVAATPDPDPDPIPPPAAPGVRRVNADEAARHNQQGSFVPLIAGVPRDPLSQGRALLEHGRAHEAISELSVAAVSGTNLIEANNLLGLAYDRLGLHAQAREHYGRALSAAPNDPHVLNNLGYSLALDHDYRGALDKLKRAARIAPANAHVHNNLAFVHGRLGKYDEAFKHFARAGGEFYARLRTGALLGSAGRDREAIKHFEAARRLDPTSTEALRQLITLYNRTGQRDKAEAARQELDRPKTKAVS